MRRLLLLLSTPVVLLLTGWLVSSFQPAPTPRDGIDPEQLEGAWRMTHRNGHTMDELHLQMVKILKDGHFMFAYYQESSQSFYSAGGGTYLYQDGRYTERIEFHTLDPDLIGQAVTFDLSMQEDRWHHSGNANGQELNEVFTRIDQGGHDNLLSGVWTEVAISEHDGQLREIRSRDPQTRKLITDQRFQWVTFDPKTGDLLGCGGGTYEWKEGIYAERIDFHQQDSLLTGHRLVWPSQVEGDTWTKTTPVPRGTEAPQRQIWRRIR